MLCHTYILTLWARQWWEMWHYSTATTCHSS